MFVASNPHIQSFVATSPSRITELEGLLTGNTNVYVDWANVLHWQDRLKWKIHPRRIIELYSSFSNVRTPKLYFGTVDADTESTSNRDKFIRWGYDLTTKPVKIMSISINATSIPSDSVDILKNFIRRPLLEHLKIATIETLNKVN